MVPMHMRRLGCLRNIPHLAARHTITSARPLALRSAASCPRVDIDAAAIRPQWAPPRPKNRPEVQRAQPASECILVQNIRAHIRNGAEEPFYVVDMQAAAERVQLWRELLPRVTPFYAVKCNPDLSLLSLFASLGIGFDCASRAEMQQVFNIGVDPSRIIYANPCKQVSHLRFAADAGVNLSVFDSEPELVKTAKTHPGCSLLLRIQVDDSKAQCAMSDKYGAPVSAAAHLLQRAADLGLDVRGVSFHVGSGCYSADAFVDAVRRAAEVHRLAADAGRPMDLVDIGGGFPGADTPHLTFAGIAAALRPALDAYFPASSGVSLIAEPGRFMAAASHTLAVNIIGKKVVTDAAGEPHTMYYVNDGLYGSFNCVVYDHAEPTFKVVPEVDGAGAGAVADAVAGADAVAVACANAAAGSNASAEAGAPVESCSIWGPTCDGFDCVVKSAQLPSLEVGRWLYFEHMGAYTAAAGSTFNGMPMPDKHFLPKLEPPNSRMAAAAAPRLMSVGVEAVASAAAAAAAA